MQHLIIILISLIFSLRIFPGQGIKRISWNDDLVELELQSLRAEAAGKPCSLEKISNRLTISSLDNDILRRITIVYKKVLKVTGDTKIILKKTQPNAGPILWECILLLLIDLASDVKALIEELTMKEQMAPCSLTQLIKSVLIDALDRVSEQQLQLEERFS